MLFLLVSILLEGCVWDIYIVVLYLDRVFDKGLEMVKLANCEVCCQNYKSACDGFILACSDRILHYLKYLNATMDALCLQWR